MHESFDEGSIFDVPGVRAAHASDPAASTGCTVVVVPDVGAVGGVDVRGSAPGTRETDLLAPVAHVSLVHAFLLTGGSAYGLDAAGGVMAELELRGIGYAIGGFVVPIVPAAVLFDLTRGDGRVRPDKAMGALATRRAFEPGARAAFGLGAVGAGSGATVGKLAGPDHASRGGVGTASRRMGDLVVGAVAACNAIGSIYDPKTNERIAGPRGADGALLDERPLLEAFARTGVLAVPSGANTTLAVVATNARSSKADVTKIAQMAHDGLASAVRPAHLSRDGDTIFACATGEVDAPVDIVGILASEAVAAAIVCGVRAANAMRA